MTEKELWIQNYMAQEGVSSSVATRAYGAMKQAQAESQAREAAANNSSQQAEAQAKQQAIAKALAEQQAQAAAAEKARQAQAQAAAEAQAREAASQAQAKAQADAQAKAQAEAQARQQAEQAAAAEKARQAQAQADAQAKAREAAAAQAAEKQRQQEQANAAAAQESARLASEAAARKQAEDQAKALQAQKQAEAEAQARNAAAAKAQATGNALAQAQAAAQAEAMKRSSDAASKKAEEDAAVKAQQVALQRAIENSKTANVNKTVMPDYAQVHTSFNPTTKVSTPTATTITPLVSYQGQVYNSTPFTKVASAENAPAITSFNSTVPQTDTSAVQLNAPDKTNYTETATTSQDINKNNPNYTKLSGIKVSDVLNKSGNVVLPGTREWNLITGAQAGMTPEQIAAQQKQNTQLQQLSGRTQGGAGVQKEVSTEVSPQKSQYDLLREQAAAAGVKERAAAEEQLKMQLASQGLGLGTGFGEKQLQKLRAEEARTQASRMGQIDVAQAAAYETSQEAQKHRDFQAQQADADRQLTRDVEQGKISLEEKSMALDAAKFDSQQEYDAWATEQGLTQDERDKAWAAAESTKQRTFTAGQSDIDRQLTAAIEQGKLDQASKELALNASQFNSKQEFDAWATEQGFNEAERQRAWDASEAAINREFTQTERVATQQFQASESAIDRQLNLAIEQGKLTQADKQLAQEAAQFKSKQEYDAWATQQGYVENDRERAWAAAQTANQQAYDEEVRVSQQNFQKDLTLLNNELDIGKMNLADQIDDANKMQSQKMDAAYQQGLVFQKQPDETSDEYQLRILKAQEGMDDMQKASFQTGIAGNSYEEYQSLRDANIAQRNALITKLDPEDETFDKELATIMSSFGSGNIAVSNQSIADQLKALQAAVAKSKPPTITTVYTEPETSA